MGKTKPELILSAGEKGFSEQFVRRCLIKGGAMGSWSKKTSRETGGTDVWKEPELRRVAINCEGAEENKFLFFWSETFFYKH